MPALKPFNIFKRKAICIQILAIRNVSGVETTTRIPSVDMLERSRGPARGIKTRRLLNRLISLIVVARRKSKRWTVMAVFRKKWSSGRIHLSPYLQPLNNNKLPCLTSPMSKTTGWHAEPATAIKSERTESSYSTQTQLIKKQLISTVGLIGNEWLQILTLSSSKIVISNQ